MKASKEMLLTNNYNIGEIADAIGYQNISKFIAAFKREYGTTPGQFKNDTSKLVPRNSTYV